MFTALKKGVTKLGVAETPAREPYNGEESHRTVRRSSFENPAEDHSNDPEQRMDEDREQSIEEVPPPCLNRWAQGQKRPTRESHTNSTKERLEAIEDHPYVRELQDTLKSNARRIRCLEESLALADTALQKERSALQKERSALHSTKKLLDERTAELQAANAFLCQTDSFSCGDIINLAETLNYEIQQVSAQISNTYGAFEPKVLSRSEEGKAFHAQDIIARKTGVDLRKTVQHPAIQNNQENRVAWIEFIIQTLLVKTICYEVLDRKWSHDANLEDALSVIYARIIEGNGAMRSIAGKWRTLTHAVSQELYGVQEMIERSLINTKRVLIAFGATDLPADDDFIATFHDDMEPVISNLIKLNTATKENMSSCRILPWIAGAGWRYRSNLMSDANSPESPMDEEGEIRVFASVTLGLAQTTNTELDVRIILKPKVVLETLLHGLDIDNDVEEIDESF